jgi:hypothetical protein
MTKKEVFEFGETGCMFYGMRELIPYLNCPREI